MNTKYLIIGGGPAGVAAAESIRRNDSGGKIVIVDREGERLYSKINLHLMLDGKIPDEKIYIKSQEFYQENGFEFIKGVALSGDAEKKEITLDAGEKIQYEKLIIATGGGPRRLAFDGDNQVGVRTFYSLDDVRIVKQDASKADHFIVIGGGFLTLDLLDALVNLGKKITLVMRDQRLLQNKTSEAGSKILEQGLLDHGVEIKREAQIEKFYQKDGAKFAQLIDGSTVEFDACVMAVGIASDLTLAESLGLKIETGIIVDEKMQTSREDIYACGDICQYRDYISGDYNMAGNWYFAQESGKAAGDNASGADAVCEATVLVAKQVFGSSMFYYGSVNQSYEMKEFINGRSCVQYFIKDGKIVGLGALNMPTSMQNLKNLLGSKFEEGLVVKP